MNFDCQQNNSCAGYNAELSLLKDYPKKYSGDGMPPSGMNPYRDDYIKGRHKHYYKRIRDVVSYNPNELYVGVNNRGGHNVNYSKRMRDPNSRSPHMPIHIYAHKDSDNPQNIAHDYRDGRFNIQHVRSIYPQKHVRKYDNSDSRFLYRGEPFEPRYINWNPKVQKEYLKHYYNVYTPTTSDSEHVHHANFLHHMKYGSKKYNKLVLDAQKKGIYHNLNTIPYNHIEHNGRQYDCSKLTKRPRTLCMDDVYSDIPLAKCEAQGKFLGRTKGDYCSLNAGLPPSIPMVKNTYLIHDIQDAAQHDLLVNNQVYRPNGRHAMQRRYHTFGMPNSHDYWDNYSYDPIGPVAWNEVGAEPNRKY